MNASYCPVLTLVWPYFQLPTDLNIDPNVKKLTDPQTHEITLQDGSKIRGTLIDLDDNRQRHFGNNRRKKNHYPQFRYTSIRILIQQ